MMAIHSFSSKLRHGFIIFILMFIPVASQAWGPEGHRIVGLIAAHYLNTQTKKELRRLVPDYNNSTLAKIANWADQIRRVRHATAPWHYVDIPLNADRFVHDRDCPNGDCVIDAIRHFEQVLIDSSSSKSERLEALKFLVHFIGDVHQPLHTINNNDKGGNTIRVTFFGQSMNLHHLWDTGIIDHTGLSARLYADYLIARFGKDPDIIHRLQQGTVVAWALQAHHLAQVYAYRRRPKNNRLGEKYYMMTRPVVDQQLFDAGVRLAGVLNGIFSKQ